MSELTSKTIAELRDGFRSGEFTRARDRRELQRRGRGGAERSTPIRSRRPTMRSPRRTRRTRRAGRATCQSLAGIPLGIKDLFATEGVDTTAGSRILKGFKPPYESTVTANLRKAGAGMLGKLNMDEFAMGSSNETSAYGPVISPWRRKGSNVGADPGRIVGRIGGGGRGGHRARRDRHRHRRLDPPAGGLRRHLRDQADLRPLLALGHRRLRKLARPGRADGEDACATARSCSRRWPGSTRRIRPRSTCRCRSGKRICRAISRASASAFPRNIASTACPREINALWDQRHRMAEGRGRDAGRDQPAAHQICASDLLHHRPGRGLVQPRPL